MSTRERCANCEAKILPDDKQCQNCGASLDKQRMEDMRNK